MTNKIGEGQSEKHPEFTNNEIYPNGAQDMTGTIMEDEIGMSDQINNEIFDVDLARVMRQLDKVRKDTHIRDISIENELHGEDYSEREDKFGLNTTSEKSTELKMEITENKIVQNRKIKKPEISSLDSEKVGDGNRDDFSCIWCGKVFLDLKSVERHEKRHTKQKTFRCNVCIKAFIKEEDFKTHDCKESEIFIKEENIQNVLIKEENTNEASMEQSDDKDIQRIQIGAKSEICSWCGKSFASGSLLVKHEDIHINPEKQRLYKCDLCGNGFINADDFLKDKLIHQKEIEIKLENEDNFDKSNYFRNLFFNDDTYRAAQETFTNDYILTYKMQIFICPLQNCQLKTDNILHHLKTDHKNHKKPLLCYTCGKITLSKQAYDKHVENAHINPQPPKIISKIKKCQYCNYQALQSHCLTEHERTHTGEKPEMCSWCGRSFAFKKSLRDHERLHTGVKPYHCEICDKSWVQLTSLNSHNKTHHKKLERKLEQKM